MSIDKAKALKAAQKYLARGQLDRAIVEFEKIVADDPNDARSLLKLGDIYTRQGDQRGAATTYRKVAAQYAEQGFFLKAMAVYKQILKLDPNDLAANESLGEMYEMLSLTNDAIATFEYVADAHARAGTPEKGLKVLERLTALDGANVANWIRYAEMLSKTNKIDEAAEAFRRGADLLKGQDRIDDYVKVTERLLFHSHEDIARARDLAEVYIERGQGKSALPHLQTCFKSDPRDPATLGLLARAFQSLGQGAKAASVYRELARVHADASRPNDERSALRKLRELDPDNQDALIRLRAIGGDEQIDEVVEMDDVELIDEEASAPGATGPLEGQDRAALVKRLMDECEVFMRYGLRDKIVAQLNRVLELDPTHIEAREKLRDTFLKRGETDGAVQQLLLLSDAVAQNNPAQSVRYLEQAAKLQPNNSTVAARLRHSLPAPPAPPPAPPRKAASQPLAPPPVVSAEPDESDFSDLASEPPTALRPKQALLPGAAEVDSEPELLLEAGDEVELQDAELQEAELQEAELEPSDLSEEVEITHEVSEEVEETHALVASSPPALEAEPWADDSGAASAERVATLPPAGVVDPAAAQVASASGAPAMSDRAVADAYGFEEEEEELPEAIAETLEEVEFYCAQKLFDEAREMLEEARLANGDHPALLAKLRELDQTTDEVASAPPPQARPPKPPGTLETTDRIALEAASSGQAPLDVGDVLKQFKDGVSRQVDKSDAATHYDLGIAYMEMSLHGEAIDEFKLCLGSDEKKRTAHTMIGLCHVARAEMQQGISHFHQALELPGLGPEEELDLWFELGNANELLEQPDEALGWYKQVAARNPGFRDVAARVARLDAPAPPPAEVDEFDAMFDSMILKD